MSGSEVILNMVEYDDISIEELERLWDYES